MSAEELAGPFRGVRKAFQERQGSEGRGAVTEGGEEAAAPGDGGKARAQVFKLQMERGQGALRRPGLCLTGWRTCPPQGALDLCLADSGEWQP